ncbi:hypothetical protein AMJ52_06365 [candidate division TA06 bacterium DG_78]|uniref:Uncharacterized protein n=1 Tax=candidate division TA06 bacterium DG_78 TaxID=1703772 RepID=A0A0S7YEA9_UNCT6|nr:MAG: hypothetical protein AMJ52_06365 [candidate division TA06 bacterium DG_78]
MPMETILRMFLLREDNGIRKQKTGYQRKVVNMNYLTDLLTDPVNEIITQVDDMLCHGNNP